MEWRDLKNVAIKEKLRWQPNARYLVQSIELEETEPSGLYSALIAIISGFIAFFVLWTGLTHIDEVARSTGTVIPLGNVQAVQHLEGGIVSEIFVRDGQIVRKGQPLLRLSPIDTRARLDQARVRRATVILAIERNRAVAEGRLPSFGEVLDGYNRLKADQQALFETEVESNLLNRSVLQRQYDQQMGELSRIANQARSQKEEVQVLSQELKTRRDLFKKGLTTREQVFQIERQHKQAKTEYKETQDSHKIAKDSVEEAQKRVAEFDNSVRTTSLTVIGELVGELAEIEETIKSHEDRNNRLNIVAPVDGIVKGLEINATNAVVKPGETLLEMVPIDGAIEVEAEISPRDIGHISVGQDVDIRITSYDFATYGSVKGELTHISASTFQSEDGSPYYRARISLDQNYLGDNPSYNPLLPGMVVEANIITGSKSIMDYMLKPIYGGFSTSFHER